MPFQRIVSLLPSATEIVCALGLTDRLVGRSHECDYPATVRDLAVCTASKLPFDGDSAGIDRSVQSIVRQALAVYRVDGERLRMLRPDVVITQTQCDVCAVTPRQVEAALEDWLDYKPKVVALQPDDLAAIWRDIGLIADALGAAGAGIELAATIRRRMQTIAEPAALAPHRPRLARIEWIEPLMSAGNWLPELVALVGGEHLFGTAGAHSPWLEWGDLRAADPDIILVHPCGWDMAMARANMHYLVDRPQWRHLKAVRSGQVYVADGNQYFNRPGPRLVESLEILAELLHPKLFARRHQGGGWQRFD